MARWSVEECWCPVCRIEHIGTIDLSRPPKVHKQFDLRDERVYVQRCVKCLTINLGDMASRWVQATERKVREEAEQAGRGLRVRK